MGRAQSLSVGSSPLAGLGGRGVASRADRRRPPAGLTPPVGTPTLRGSSGQYPHTGARSIEDQPALHQSIPQGHHLHTLLLGGQQVMASLYPGFLEGLATLGAVRCRAGKDVVFYLPTGKAYSITGTVREPRDLGFDITCHSRGLLEHCVRQCTRQHPNISFACQSTVQGLVGTDGHVRGLRYTRAGEPHTLATDLVVDAGGRQSQTPRWLTEPGFQAPEVTPIGVDMAYASTKFRVPDDYDEPEPLLVVMGPPPDSPNAAVIEVIEDQTWHVTLAGRFGNYPPHDAEGFLAFARALHSPRVYDLVKGAERVADITAYRFPTGVQRHYERLTTFPEGLVEVGALRPILDARVHGVEGREWPGVLGRGAQAGAVSLTGEFPVP